MNKKLYRDEYHKVLGGVCSGIAEYFDMDVTVVRLLFAFVTLATLSAGLIPYIILWIVLPKKGYIFNNNFNNPMVDYTVPKPPPAGQFNTPPPTPPGSAFGSSPYSSGPFSVPGNIPPKPRSNAGIIAGVVLIIIGAVVLIDNYDLIPDFDFGRLWPLVLVIIGGAFIASGQKKQPWHKDDWHTGDKKEETTEDIPPAADNTPIVE